MIRIIMRIVRISRGYLGSARIANFFLWNGQLQTLGAKIQRGTQVLRFSLSRTY